MKLRLPAMESTTSTMNIGATMKILMPHLNETFNIDSVLMCGVECSTTNCLVLFVLDGCLTGDGYLRFLEDLVTNMLDDVLLIVRHRMYFQHDGAPPVFVIVGLAEEDLMFGHRDHQT